MIRYAEWQEAFDPEFPLARFDGAVKIFGGVVGLACGYFCCCIVGSLPLAYFFARSAANALVMRDGGWRQYRLELRKVVALRITSDS